MSGFLDRFRFLGAADVGAEEEEEEDEDEDEDEDLTDASRVGAGGGVCFEIL